MQGFTLMEILVAFFIFAIIMGIVVTGISISITAEEKISSRSKRIGDIQLAMAVISADLEQVIIRPIIDNNGDLLPPYEFDTEDIDLIEFTRGGLPNPLMLEKRSTLQRVAYKFIDGQLIRKSWRVLDRANSSTFSQRVILEDVRNVEIALLPVSTNTQPQAILVKISTDTFGTVSRLYALHGIDEVPK